MSTYLGVSFPQPGRPPEPQSPPIQGCQLDMHPLGRPRRYPPLDLNLVLVQILLVVYLKLEPTNPRGQQTGKLGPGKLAPDAAARPVEERHEGVVALGT